MKQTIDHLSHTALREYLKVLIAARPKRPQLLYPKSSYFTKGGIDLLAIDFAATLFHEPPTIHIVHKNSSQSYTLLMRPSGDVRITLDQSLLDEPHIQAYTVCRAVIHHHISMQLPDILFRFDAAEALINSLFIKHGLGIFALNANEELQDFGAKAALRGGDNFLSRRDSLDSAFQAFCKHYRIDIRQTSAFLLPQAAKRICGEAPPSNPEPYVLKYAQQRNYNSKIRRLKITFFVVAGAAIAGLLYAGIVVFNQDQRLQKEEIVSIKADLTTCIDDLEAMIDTVQTQDIYTLRSIADKRGECESLRELHEQLLNENTK